MDKDEASMILLTVSKTSLTVLDKAILFVILAISCLLIGWIKDPF